MQIATATGTREEFGPLSERVVRFGEMMEAGAQATGEPIDWAAYDELVATDEFKRVGAYMEVMNWKEYTRFISEWAGKTRFEYTVLRVSEVGQLVFFEIEERHYKGEDFIRKNVMAVYEFDNDKRIRHLDIYEQAKDSGQWIIDAAHSAKSGAAG
jgi:limonene-1,2-epoxide hydrolase